MGNYNSTQITTQTQKNFDPSRYQGKWQEIARYPFIWEKDCYSAEADYTWNDQKKILYVKNICLDENFKPKRTRFGEARVVNPDDMSKLSLKFTDGLPSGPESPYWVFKTDYVNYSIVGEPTGNFLWVLTREPYVERDDIQYIKMVVKRLGYDPEKLLFPEKRIMN